MNRRRSVPCCSSISDTTRELFYSLCPHKCEGLNSAMHGKKSCDTNGDKRKEVTTIDFTSIDNSPDKEIISKRFKSVSTNTNATRNSESPDSDEFRINYGLHSPHVASDSPTLKIINSNGFMHQTNVAPQRQLPPFTAVESTSEAS